MPVRNGEVPVGVVGSFAPASTPASRVRRALAQDLAASEAGVWVTCASASMAPTVRPGDRVRVRAGERIRVGDVILFETSDGRGLVLHRLVATVPATPYFLHAGDADGARLGASRRERIVGVAYLPRRRPSAAMMARAAAYLAHATGRRIARSLHPRRWG